MNTKSIPESEETNCTPAPWVFDESDHDWRTLPFVRSAVKYPGAEKGAAVCKMATVFGRAQMRHNARLIAAAPDLLHACKVALENLTPDNASAEPYLLKAIAKAEGRAL